MVPSFLESLWRYLVMYSKFSQLHANSNAFSFLLTDNKSEICL